MNLVSWLIYIPLQILFIPIGILAAVLVGYKQIVVSKRLGISMTAIEVINGRWTMHIFGMRDDEATARLAATLPNTSLGGLWAFLFPLWIKYKIAGVPALYPRIPALGAETVADLIIARTLYFDRIIERVRGDVAQFVVLGAGYDMRAYGDLQDQGVACFELDQPGGQQHKIDSLKAAGLSCAHVNFVSIDFARENAIEKLTEAGWNKEAKTLFLWEGVTLYLSEADIHKTLRQLHEHGAEGSVLLADFYAERFIKFASKGASKKSLELTDEGVKFGLDLSVDYETVLKDFLAGESLSVGQTFFLGSGSAKGPYAVVAEILLQ